MLVSINPLPLQIQKGFRSEGGRLIHTEASAPHWNEDLSLWSPCPGLIFFPFLSQPWQTVHPPSVIFSVND